MVSETPTYAASAIEIMNSLLAEEEASVVSASPSADIVALRTCVTHHAAQLWKCCSFVQVALRSDGWASLRTSLPYGKPDINGFSDETEICEVAR